MLRKYAKLCKKEGIQSDRVNLGDSKKVISAPVVKDSNKTIPFKKSLAKAEIQKDEMRKKVEKEGEK